MKLFRIERTRHVHLALSGQGAALSAGNRWNSEHTRLVYTSETRSLAVLEVLVHFNSAQNLPTDRLLLEIDVPDELHALHTTPSKLPMDWDLKPPGGSTQRIGDSFVEAMQAPLLKVPSAIVPGEWNWLINPAHPDAREIRITAQHPLPFDSRLQRP